MGSIVVTRREATLERQGTVYRSAVAPRRRIVCLAAVRGLNPTATIVVSLRETGRECPNSRCCRQDAGSTLNRYQFGYSQDFRDKGTRRSAFPLSMERTQFITSTVSSREIRSPAAGQKSMFFPRDAWFNPPDYGL